MKTLRLIAVSLLLSTPSFAQDYGYDSSWNATGPKPLPCFFNGQSYFTAEDVCVGKGVKQVCGSDGSFGQPVAEPSCTGPVAPSRSYTTGTVPRGMTVCAIGHEKFAIGAQICTGAGTKSVCQSNGTLSAASPESSCQNAAVP